MMMSDSDHSNYEDCKEYLSSGSRKKKYVRQGNQRRNLSLLSNKTKKDVRCSAANSSKKHSSKSMLHRRPNRQKFNDDAYEDCNDSDDSKECNSGPSILDISSTKFNNDSRSRSSLSRDHQYLHRLQPVLIQQPPSVDTTGSATTATTTGTDQDQEERKDYINVLSQLIKLNMPAHIESSRSHEAYRNRDLFLQQRRRLHYGSNQSSWTNNHDDSRPRAQQQQREPQHQFCTDEFWQELQDRVRGRKKDHIMSVRAQLPKIIKNINEFRFEDETELRNAATESVKSESSYGISVTYLKRLQSAYKSVTRAVSRYHRQVSYWSSSAAMLEEVPHVSGDAEGGQLQHLQMQLATLQVWLSCCEWLNWKTGQIALLLELPVRSMHRVAIRHRMHQKQLQPSSCLVRLRGGENQLGSKQDSSPPHQEQENYHHNNRDGGDCGDATITSPTSDQTPCGTAKCRSRCLSLSSSHPDPTSQQLLSPTHTDGEGGGDMSISQELLEDSDDGHEDDAELLQRQMDQFADNCYRRQGLERMCNCAIASVRPILLKIQTVLSITNDEHTMPLVHSFAHIVKDRGLHGQCRQHMHMHPHPHPHSQQDQCTSFAANNVLIYSENRSQTAPGPGGAQFNVGVDDIEFPQINSMNLADITDNSGLGESDSESAMSPSSLSNAPQQQQQQQQQEVAPVETPVRGLLGLHNEVVAGMKLPPLLPHYLFLARFPVRLMDCCVRRLIKDSDLSSFAELTPITVKQKINDFKSALKYTMKARQFLCDITFGINFQIRRFEVSRTRNFAPQQELDQTDFVRDSMKQIDSRLSWVLRLYMQCIKQLLSNWCSQSTTNKLIREEPRKLLEEEWRFVKMYCHSIRQEEEVVASSFCQLAEHLFDLLRQEIETEHKLHPEINNLSPENAGSVDEISIDQESSRALKTSNYFQEYKIKCKILQSRLKQATEFAKMLRSDLEISLQLQLTCKYSMANFLFYLQSTRHKLVNMCPLDIVSELNLIVPEESSQHLTELLHPLVTGFYHQPRDDHEAADRSGAGGSGTGTYGGTSDTNSSSSNGPPGCKPKVDNVHSASVHHMTGVSGVSGMTQNRRLVTREYILVINKNSAISWKGDRVSFCYPLDIENLRERLENTNILFLARRPADLMSQLQNFRDWSISESPPATAATTATVSNSVFASISSSNSTSAAATQVLRFSDVVHPAGSSQLQPEVCHHLTKRKLTSLKNKVIEVATALVQEFLVGRSLYRPPQMHENTVSGAIKHSYSITFEFYRDIIKICTGDAFKNTLKSTVINLAEKWFKFSKSCEPSENRTVPRWANDGLNFLLQVFHSRIVMNMSSKEWQAFKVHVDEFIEFIVGPGTRRHNSDGSGRSTGSSRAVYGKFWTASRLPQKPSVIDDCDSHVSNDTKVQQWETQQDLRQLRMSFSEPHELENMMTTNAHSNNEFVQILHSKNEDRREAPVPVTAVSVDPSCTVSVTVDTFSDHHSNKSTDGSRDNPNDSSSCGDCCFHCHLDNDTDHKAAVTTGPRVPMLHCYRHHRQRDKRFLGPLRALDLEREKKLCEGKMIGRIRLDNDQKGRKNFVKKIHFKWIKREPIGFGVSANVFKVFNCENGNLMAMKELVLSEPLFHDPTEYDFYSKLEHDSLLKFYGVEVTLSHLCIFTQYCDGGSLAEVSVLELPEATLRSWTSQVVSALVYIHDKEIVHRDVKPQNIFLINIEDQCKVKLGDFGTAETLDNNKSLKDEKGTMMYMAPEIVLVKSQENLSGAGYTKKVDIWSLGCTVLFMLTGKPPWPFENRFSIWFKLGSKEKPLIPVDCPHNAGNTREAQDFMHRCLSVDPDERPNASDLLNMHFVQCINQ